MVVVAGTVVAGTVTAGVTMAIWGPGAALGLGLGLGLAAPYAYGGGGGYAYAGGSHVQWCLNRYRTYDPRSNTYVGNDGYRHACRY